MSATRLPMSLGSQLQSGTNFTQEPGSQESPRGHYHLASEAKRYPMADKGPNPSGWWGGVCVSCRCWCLAINTTVPSVYKLSIDQTLNQTHLVGGVSKLPPQISLPTPSSLALSLDLGRASYAFSQLPCKFVYQMSISPGSYHWIEY
jgi:hypothetical protein